ncbi:hypothetical protein DRO33_01625 [Candidatus Bathyarchaeota archaeon]|nr:MAG: hypothetical protein DRO33_01625 [Candidatus Bathyarchaeota archaeon]
MAGEEALLETELCHFCLKTGVLCQRCEEKLRSGKLGPSYMEIARLLLELEAKGIGALQQAHLLNVAEVGDVLVLVFKRGDLTRLRPVRGRLARALEERTGKRVHLIEGDVDERTFLEQLFWPSTLLTINKIWLPDDSVETRVILRGKKPWAKIDALKQVAKQLKGLSLRVEFVR